MSKEEKSEEVLRQELAEEVWGGKQPVIEQVEEPEVEPEEVAEEPEEVIESDGTEEEPETDPLQEKLNEIADRVGLIENLDYRLKQAERRLGSVQNTLSEEKAAQEAAKEAAANAPTKEQLEEAVKDDLAWDEVKDLYPEIAEGIERKLAKAKPQEVDVKALRADLINEIHPQIKEEITLGIQPDIVAIVHPDFHEIDASKEFSDWLPKQSEEIKQKAASPWAKDVIEVIGKFKDVKPRRDPKEIQAERDRRLDRAEVKKPTGRALKQKTLDEMTEQEVRDYYAQHYDDL